MELIRQTRTERLCAGIDVALIFLRMHHQEFAPKKFEHLRYKDKSCYYYGLGISSFKLLAKRTIRTGGRAVEGARLESVYTFIAYRGFESPSVRQEFSTRKPALRKLGGFFVVCDGLGLPEGQRRPCSI